MHAKLMKWSRQSSKKKDFHSTQFQLVTFDIMDSSTIHNIEYHSDLWGKVQIL